MSTTTYHEDIPERVVSGARLGRWVAHDPRSWRYPAPMSDEIVSCEHEIPILLDQNQLVSFKGHSYPGLGSCTGNALCYMLMSPLFVERTRRVKAGDLNQEDAVRFYSRATEIDPFKGRFPTQDTGSNGLAVLKAAREDQYLDGYAHCFSLEHFARTLVIQPTIAGTLWLSEMDNPGPDGVVHARGSSRGGHEYVQCGLVINNSEELRSPDNLVKCKQSWGDWGIDGGYFYIPMDEFDYLRKQQGDIKTGILL